MPIETGTTSTSQFDAVLSNIDRLFDERVEFYGLVDLNKSAVLSSICKVLIKVCPFCSFMCVELLNWLNE